MMWWLRPMLETLGTVCVLSLGCFKSTYFISRTFSGHIVWRSAYRNVLNIFLCAIYKQESNHMRDYELEVFFFFFFQRCIARFYRAPKGTWWWKKIWNRRNTYIIECFCVPLRNVAFSHKTCVSCHVHPNSTSGLISCQQQGRGSDMTCS